MAAFYSHTWMLSASSRSRAVMGSMLNMRQLVKSARAATSASGMDHGTLGRQAYTYSTWQATPKIRKASPQAEWH
jgi:hypothetical protein